MSAVTERITAAGLDTAEATLINRGFVRTTPGKGVPNQWMNGAHHWATIEKMPSGKFLVKIGVATI